MSDQELARDLGFLEAYTLGLGTMIGAGIFVLPGVVAGRAGPASMLSFVVGGSVALLAALSLSELATGMPKAGGSYYYVNQALGGLFGSIVGWGMWGGLMFATAFYMLGFGQYLIGASSEALAVVAAALVMATILVAINYRGVKETGSLQNVIVIALLGLISVFVVVGLVAIDPDLLVPFAPEGWSAVGLTAGTVFVTFIGFEVIATSAEEIKRPGKNLPLSMIAAVVTPTILYVLVMAVSTGLLEIPTLEDSPIPVADVAAASVERFGTVSVFGLADVSLAGLASGAMVVGAILATVSSANASILSAARVNFAMGRDRILSDWLNQIHGVYRTPYRAIIATGAVILVLIAGPLPIDTLADVASFMFLITYALVHVSVVILRRADPDGYEPDFRIPGALYPVVPIVGALACLGVMAQMRLVVQGIGLLIVLVGILWYVFYARERSEVQSLLGEAVAPTPEGEPEDDERYTVVVPLANPETQDPLLRYAAASAAGHEAEAELVAVNVLEVPPQTSLAQEVEMEEQRIERQNQILSQARAVGEEMAVPVRTRAIVGRNTTEVLLDVVREENADQILLGWGGAKSRQEVVFGSVIDTILERAPCEVTLVRNPTEVSEIVVLAGQGENAPVAARRAVEFSRSFDATLRLLNVQPEVSEDEEDDPRERGRETVTALATAAGIEDEEYTVDVRVATDVRETLVEAVRDVDAVSVGATGQSFVAQALYGTIPRAIAESATGTVIMARGENKSPRTLTEAIVQRLGGRIDA